MLDSKHLGDRLIKIINEELGELDHSKEIEVREIVFTAFKEGYADCLKDLKEGLIK